jgi:hypothetical protein
MAESKAQANPAAQRTGAPKADAVTESAERRKRRGICREAVMAGALGERSAWVVCTVRASPEARLLGGDLDALSAGPRLRKEDWTGCRWTGGGVAGIYDLHRDPPPSLLQPMRARGVQWPKGG